MGPTPATVTDDDCGARAGGPGAGGFDAPGALGGSGGGEEAGRWGAGRGKGAWKPDAPPRDLNAMWR